MKDPVLDSPFSDLRRRMQEEDMAVRRFGEKTQPTISGTSRTS